MARTRISLHLDWCNRKAASYALKYWLHGAGLPTAASNRIGVWEEGEFRACLVFTRAEQVASAQFGLTRLETLELTHFARWKLRSPFSRISKIAIDLIREQNPNARMLVAFVDAPNTGTCLQASSWYYLGFGFPGSNRRHAYAWPLDRDARFLLEGLCVPYPQKQAAVRVS